MGRGSVPAKTHARRVAPFDELGLDGSLTPSMQAECDCAFRVVEKHRALRSSELLAALSVCGFSLSERELLEVAGPELLAQPQLSRADFQTIYLRLTATDLTLDQSVRRAFGIFDDDQAGRLDHSTLRRVLAAAAGSDEAAADRRIAALGIGDPGVLDVAEFVHELRASLVATAELSAHARKGDGLVGLSLEVDRERCEEEERLQYAAELAELQPELAWHLSRLRPQVDGVALELDALFFTLLTDLGFATGESRFEAPQAAEELLGQLARALVACAVQLHARGKAPLQLSLEVHTQDTHPEAQMAVLSLRRAEAARGVLRRQLRASWPAELLQAGVHDGDVLIEAVGHGGSMLLNRRALEVRVLSPDEARRARVQAALSPAAGEAGGAAGESAGVSEGEAYGEELARVQAEAERRIGSRAPLVSLDLLHLSVRTERQWLFLGDRAEYVDGPSEAELIGQTAVALVECNAALAAQGMPLLVVALEGHTANKEPVAFNETLSLQRAERVRADVLFAMLLLPTNSMSHAALQRHVLARGLGGSVKLERCVELRVLPPSEAQVAQEGVHGGIGAVVAVAAAALAEGEGEEGRPSGLSHKPKYPAQVSFSSSGYTDEDAAPPADARAAYGRELRVVQAGALLRLGEPLSLVQLDLPNLEVVSQRQWLFGEGNQYVEPAEEEELLSQVAAALLAVLVECEAQGMALALFAVEGHTWHKQPKEDAHARSLARAQRVRGDILARLLALPAKERGGIGDVQLERCFLALGHGGAHGKGSLVELRVLLPAEAASLVLAAEEAHAQEKETLARSLATVGAEAKKELQALRLVRLEADELLLALLRQFKFQGDAAEYARPEEEKELLDQIANALHTLARLLAKHGLPPLAVELGGHTRNKDVSGETGNARLSVQRAQRVRQDLLLRLRALDAQDSSDSHLGNGNGSNLAPLLLVCRGYGGEEVLERRVTVKFLPPAQLEDARARKAREAVAQQASGTVGKALSLSAADKAEALAYAQTLAAVHAQALPELQRLKLVDLDLSLGQLQVRLLRQFQFAGNAATYESDADEEELLDELAVCLHLLGQALGRRGEGPLYLALEGHTANAEPKEYNETLSLQRAERVRADLLARLQKLGASSSSLAAAGSSRAANGHFGGEQARIVCRGYGGSQMRRRCVEVRVLSPAEARAELGETAPADGAVAGAAAGTGGEHAGPDFGGTWALESSNGLDNFLKTMGVGPLKRKLADGFRPTQEWSRGAGGSWQLAMLTPTGEQTEVLPIGRPVPDEINGVSVLKTSSWHGDVLVTKVLLREPRVKEALGYPETIEFRRYLRARGSAQSSKLIGREGQQSGGEEMVLEMRVEGVTCTRVFARLEKGVNGFGRSARLSAESDTFDSEGRSMRLTATHVTGQSAIDQSASGKAPALTVTGGEGEEEGGEGQAEAEHLASMAAFTPYDKSPSRTPIPSPAPISSPPASPEVPRLHPLPAKHSSSLLAPSAHAHATPQVEALPRTQRAALPVGSAAATGVAEQAAAQEVGMEAAKPLSPLLPGIPASASALQSSLFLSGSFEASDEFNKASTPAVSTSASASSIPLAPAGSAVDFAGVWVLSDSRQLEEYLAALGVHWAKRKAAGGMKPKHDWKRVNGEWQFSVSTVLGLKTEAFPLGVEVLDDIDGIKMSKLSRWEGEVLLTDVTPTDPERARTMKKMLMRRYLSGSGASVKLVLEMVYGDITCTRVFSRLG